MQISLACADHVRVKSPDTILTASEEKTNGTRLAQLLTDGGTHVLREYLYSIHPTGTLQAVLNNNLTRLQSGEINPFHMKARRQTMPHRTQTTVL